MNNEDVKQAIERIVDELQSIPDIGWYHVVLIGRFCPLHIGHQILMESIVKAKPLDHTILIGSCNQDLSIRNLFNYSDRRGFIKKLIPNAHVAPISDFVDDEIWFTALDDIIRLNSSKSVLFVGGCEEDVEWYYKNKREVYIVNRFSGKTLNVSGTEIRDHLISKNREMLKRLIDPLILDDVQRVFEQRWNELRRK